MAKKKEVIVVPVRTEWNKAMSEERRKELFPRHPPPNWKELKQMKGKKNGNEIDKAN